MLNFTSIFLKRQSSCGLLHFSVDSPNKRLEMKTLAVLVIFGMLSWSVNADSCSNRCGRMDSSKSCQCNSGCTGFGDCCTDYNSLCVASSTSTLSDFTTVANAIWSRDVNRLTTAQYSLDYQTSVSSSGTTDQSTRKLFRSLQESQFSSKVTYRRFIALLNNYNSNTGSTESITTAEWTEVDDFLDAILATSVMNTTESFLRYYGKVSGGRSAFKDKLFKIWFELYRRSPSTRARISSSGFEHVFVGETSSTKVTGFHSWIQFYLEEKAGRLNYAGYVSKLEPRLIGSQFSWSNNLWKAKGTFFVGTSPEFDMAIYTICFLMKPGEECKFKIANRNLVIQTYDNENWAGQQIGTAYVK